MTVRSYGNKGTPASICTATFGRRAINQPIGFKLFSEKVADTHTKYVCYLMQTLQRRVTPSTDKLAHGLWCDVNSLG